MFGAQRFFIILTVTCFIADFTQGQETSEWRRKALAAISKVESYPTGVIKGSATYMGKADGKVHLHFRGGKYWAEFDRMEVQDEKDRKRILASYEIMGAKDLLPTHEFDGNKLYSFKPYTLTLTIQDARKLPGTFAECALVPKYWLRMGANPRQDFRKVIEGKTGEWNAEPLADGCWKIKNFNIGANRSGGNASVEIHERYVVIDEKCDFLVTEYGALGQQGKLKGSLQWEQHDGNWFARKGQQTVNEQPWAEWEISEISFDATKARTKFDDLPDTVPFATRFITENEKGEESAWEYKGGKAGEAEYNLRELAWLSRQKAGF